MWSDLTVACGTGYISYSACARACCSVISALLLYGTYKNIFSFPVLPVIQNCNSGLDLEKVSAFQLCEQDMTENTNLNSMYMILPLPSLNVSEYENYAHMVTCDTDDTAHVTHCFLALDINSVCLTHDDVTDRGEIFWQSNRLLSLCWHSLKAMPVHFVCARSGDPLPYTLVCDHRQDCLNNDDEDFCVFPPCSGDTPLKCATSQQVRDKLTAAGCLPTMIFNHTHTQFNVCLCMIVCVYVFGL